MKSKVQMMLAWAVVVGIVGILAGCVATQTKQETIKEPTVGLVAAETEVTMAGAETSISWAGYTPEEMDKMRVTEVAFPTGDKKTSAILLREVMPVEVLLGGEYIYEYHVTNLTDLTHQNVMVTNEGSRNLEIVSSTPKVMVGDNGSLRWIIGDLSPRETTVIRVKATSGAVGTASDCVSVMYENTLCAMTKVVDPDLLLIKTAKTDGTVCEDFWFTYEVVNPGSGMANNIRIRDEIPSGLRTVDGNKRVVEIDAGDLSPGERRQFTVEARGVETGKHRSIAVATADGGLISKSENIETLIYEPVLTITKTGDVNRFIGTNVDYDITVTNKGDAAAESTVLTDNIPSNTSFVSASGSDRIESPVVGQSGAVTWHLGTLQPLKSRTVSLTVRADSPGQAENCVTANAECADAVTDCATTLLAGIPAVLLEVIDLSDPIEIGGTLTYEITVTNQGSAADTGIAIVCTLEEGTMRYISADGPTSGSIVGNVVTFAPLSYLAPKDKATWKLNIKAVNTGDVRLSVRLNTDQLERDVEEEEATRFYE